MFMRFNSLVLFLFLIVSATQTLASMPAVNIISLNGGASSAHSNFLSVNLQLAGNSAVSSFCLKYNTITPPSASDSCWVSVSSWLAGSQTPSTSITISGYSYELGNQAGSYTVYAWAEDQAGNISSLSNSGNGTSGIDMATITYNPSPSVTACPTGTVNVTCAGDGVTDVTSCLNNFINGPNSTIVFPANQKFLVSGQIWVPANKTLIGNTSTLLSKSSTVTLAIGGNSISVCGLNIQQQGTPPNAPIVNITSSIKNISFKNSTITGSAPESLYISPGGPTNNVLIQGNTFSGAGYGILLNTGNQGTNLSNYANNITIDNNTFSNLSSDAIEINSPVMNMSNGSKTPGLAVQNIAITNNNITNSGEFGIGFAGGINSIISGNTISGTGTPAGSANVQGIHIEDYASNVVVLGNNISNTASGKYHDAIYVTQSDHIHVYQNTVNYPGDVGIALYGNNSNGMSVLAANNISNSPSSAIYVGYSPSIYVGPLQGYAGNTTQNSANLGNQPGQGSILLDSGTTGSVITGNSGN